MLIDNDVYYLSVLFPYLFKLLLNFYENDIQIFISIEYNVLLHKGKGKIELLLNNI